MEDSLLQMPEHKRNKNFEEISAAPNQEADPKQFFSLNKQTKFIFYPLQIHQKYRHKSSLHTIYHLNHQKQPSHLRITQILDPS